MIHGTRYFRLSLWLLLSLGALAINVRGNTWYLAVQTADTVNTPATLSGYKGQYRVNSEAWTDMQSLSWFGSGIYYNASGLAVSHSGTFSMRLIRTSDSYVVGTVGPWTVTGGGPVASQPERTVTFTPAPSSWSIDKTFRNESDRRRQYRIDIDGDGDWDYSPTLGPGETFRLNVTTDQAPTEDIVVEQSVYLGDGQYGWENTLSLDPSEWSTSTPTPANVPLPAPAPKAVDTTSRNSTNTVYNTPSGGNVQESTFKTGIESLKGSVTSGADKAAEAVDKLRKELEKWLGWEEEYDPTEDANAGQSATERQRDEIQQSIASAGTTNTTALSTGTLTGTAPGEDFFYWGPTEARVFFGMGELSSFFGWGRQFMLWALIVAYVGWFYWYTFSALHRVMLAQQGISAGKLPLMSGLLSWALIGLIFTVIGLATITLTQAMTQAALQVSSQATWATYSIASIGSGPDITVARMLYLANMYVPLTEAFNLIAAATAHIWTAESVAAGAILSIKAATA